MRRPSLRARALRIEKVHRTHYLTPLSVMTSAFARVAFWSGAEPGGDGPALDILADQ